MLKKHYFSGVHQFFQISPGMKCLYDWGRKHLFFSRGGIIWDQEGNFRKFIDRGSHRDAFHQGTWTGCINHFMKKSARYLGFQKSYQCFSKICATCSAFQNSTIFSNFITFFFCKSQDLKILEKDF